MDWDEWNEAERLTAILSLGFAYAQPNLRAFQNLCKFGFILFAIG